LRISFLLSRSSMASVLKTATGVDNVSVVTPPVRVPAVKR
jgi:hypothetical protein